MENLSAFISWSSQCFPLDTFLKAYLLIFEQRRAEYLQVTKPAMVSSLCSKHMSAGVQSHDNLVSRQTFIDQMSTLLKNKVNQFDIPGRKEGGIIKLCISFKLQSYTKQNMKLRAMLCSAI